MIHLKVILNTLSALIMFLALSLVPPAIIAWFYNEADFSSFIITIIISFVTGFSLFLFTRKHGQELRAKDGFLIVTLGWTIFSFLGALPFFISGFIPSYTDAFFETMSGFSTTGATILTDIEALPHGLLFWRSLTHWLG